MERSILPWGPGDVMQHLPPYRLHMMEPERAIVLVADHVQGRHHRHDCPPFSCGPLSNVPSPFRRRGDPPGCGLPSYELVCSDSNATIRIDDATYCVARINQTESTFWVVDADLDLYSNSCPLPRWNRLPYPIEFQGHSIQVELAPDADWLATFVNCSREIKNNGMYRPVACLSTSYSFVYVLTCLSKSYLCESYRMENLEPSCGYLGMAPLMLPWNASLSYADVAKSMRNGFSVRFPFTVYNFLDIKRCLLRSISDFRGKPTFSTGTNNRIADILVIDVNFWGCVMRGLAPRSPSKAMAYFYVGMELTIPYGMWIMKFAVLCRFVLAPLAALTFLAHKYWKTRITIDTVERFLRMQQMLGPTRYAYTDITAITSHFRDKLGQGGYGSVYKGVLLPGDVHVAVKMLGNSNCNGEEFISEVATIGRIHHVNVVRLMGFCSEEMRRALVYEYMPCGSLDKYIFSLEKSFSWDKLNEIALGIARGIDYLHQGCDMQIIHFDIKPHNILLDSNFVPKVADFGLAKLYPRDRSFVPTSALRGTVGYIAPEMISRSFGVISSKSDVYSFGMLLLEMAGGRRNADPNAANSSQAYYPSWVYDRLTEQQEVGEITAANMHELERKLCIVGLCCIQMKSHDRPTMSEVIEMLEASVDGLQVPSRPFFCDEEHIVPVADSYHFSSELTAISEDNE